RRGRQELPPGPSQSPRVRHRGPDRGRSRRRVPRRPHRRGRLPGPSQSRGAPRTPRHDLNVAAAPWVGTDPEEHAGRMATTTWTTLGTLGGTGSARVDGAGHVGSTDGSWTFGWSIGAEDRWHDPADTANVRQTCLDDAPVVE